MAYVVSVTWTAAEGEGDAVAAALERLRKPTLAEEGVQMWIPHRDPKDPKVFYIYEQYSDEAAYTAHTETEHFQRDGFGDAIPRLADRRREFYETMG
jgi:autoinducer 2-degrading protein